MDWIPKIQKQDSEVIRIYVFQWREYVVLYVLHCVRTVGGSTERSQPRDCHFLDTKNLRQEKCNLSIFHVLYATVSATRNVFFTVKSGL